MSFVVTVRNVPLDVTLADVENCVYSWLGDELPYVNCWKSTKRPPHVQHTLVFFRFETLELAMEAYSGLRKKTRFIGNNRVYFGEPQPFRTKKPQPKPPTPPTSKPLELEVLRPIPTYKLPDPILFYKLPFDAAGFAFWTEYWTSQTHLENFFSVRYGVRMLREPIPWQVRFVGPQDKLDLLRADADAQFVAGLFSHEFELKPGEVNDWITQGGKHLLLVHTVLPIASITKSSNSVVFYSFARGALRTCIELFSHSVMVAI